MNEIQTIRKLLIEKLIVINKNISPESILLIENLVNQLPIKMSKKLINFSSEQIIQLATGMETYTTDEIEKIHQQQMLTWVESVMEWAILDACPFLNTNACQYKNCDDCLIDRLSQKREYQSFYINCIPTPLSINGLASRLNPEIKEDSQKIKQIKKNN